MQGRASFVFITVQAVEPVLGTEGVGVVGAQYPQLGVEDLPEFGLGGPPGRGARPNDSNGVPGSLKAADWTATGP